MRSDGCIILKYLVIAYNMLENYFFQEIRLSNKESDSYW